MPRLTTSDGTDLFYVDWGSGPPIVFSHSWALSSDQFHYLVHPLVARGFRCIAFDRRGHGRSDRPGVGMDLDRFADDLAELVAHLHLGDVTHVGHSFGCTEIVRYVTRHGAAAVARALFLAPMMPLLVRTDDNPDGVDRSFVQASADLLSRDVPGWCAQNGGLFFGTDPRVSQGIYDWTLRQIVDTPVKTLVDTMWIGVTTDMRSELAGFDVPTLVVHGTADASTPLDLTGRKVVELLPRGALATIEGAGHGLYVNDAERVLAELHRFHDGAAAAVRSAG
jgi:non-heme chloroperoxidase